MVTAACVFESPPTAADICQTEDSQTRYEEVPTACPCAVQSSASLPLARRRRLPDLRTRFLEKNVNRKGKFFFLWQRHDKPKSRSMSKLICWAFSMSMASRPEDYSVRALSEHGPKVIDKAWSGRLQELVNTHKTLHRINISLWGRRWNWRGIWYITVEIGRWKGQSKCQRLQVIRSSVAAGFSRRALSVVGLFSRCFRCELGEMAHFFWATAEFPRMSLFMVWPSLMTLPLLSGAWSKTVDGGIVTWTPSKARWLFFASHSGGEISADAPDSLEFCRCSWRFVFLWHFSVSDVRLHKCASVWNFMFKIPWVCQGLRSSTVL